MQVAFLFLALSSIAVPLVAQTMPQPPSDGLPAELSSFFAFTDDQVRQIVGINQNYQSAYGVDEAAIGRLYQQIAAETAKPVLDATALGTLYVALEQLRRDERAAQSQTLNAITQLLAPAQRTKLQMLQDALNLQPLITLAIQSNFLLVPPLPASAPVTLAFRKIPEQLPSAIEHRR